MDERTIDLYLLNEMSEEDRGKLEDQFAADEGLFYEIVERENELVDRYAAGELLSDERTRFERSLATNPARRQKVANSKMLREFIAGEREQKTITLAERSGFFAKLADSFRMPVLQLATAGLLIVFALWSTYLLVENRRLKTLDEELAAARGREAELSSQLENERGATGDLTAELDGERSRIQKLEDELTKLKQSSATNRTPITPETAPPTIATLILSPFSVRGPSAMPTLVLKPSMTRASIVVDLPAETGERVTARLNGEALAENLRVGKRAGEKSISLIVPANRLKNGPNRIEILTPGEDKPTERAFFVNRSE